MSMPTIQMLSEEEQSQMHTDLKAYANVEDDGSLLEYLTEMDVADGDVELRFFATPEQGPVEGVRFEVSVYDSASWKEDMGAYSSDNLRNGGPHYEALAEELETIVRSVTGETPDFVMTKGGAAFTAEVEV